jgi:hypothetical protein
MFCCVNCQRFCGVFWRGLLYVANDECESWIGLLSTLCFLFFVVIPLRLWWVMRMSAEGIKGENELHGKGRAL